MAAVPRCQLQSSNSRCCPCMKNGRCVRCQCVKNRRSCVDCRPSTSIPNRCENRCENSGSSSSTPESASIVPDDPSAPPVTQPSGQRDLNDFDSLRDFLSQPNRMLKRIPRLSRVTVARKLAEVIRVVVSRNDEPAWTRLLSFPRRCFCAPARGGHR